MMKMQLIISVLFLALVACAPPPTDWVPRIKQAQMLFTETEPKDTEMMASIGNGYLATVVGSPIIYLSGVYNGLNTATPSHRAIIPATNAFTVVDAVATGSAIDLERATYYRQSSLSGATIEQRWYAHRTRRSVLVHEIFVDNSVNNKDLSFKLTLNTNATEDFTVQQLPDGPGYSQYTAAIKLPEEPSGYRTSISTVSSLVPTTFSVTGRQKQTFYLLTAIRTNLDSSNPEVDARTDFSSASGATSELFSTHVEAWKTIWEARLEVEGDLRLAQVINGSMYYILSSIRDDWPYSISPGSLSSNGYNGHVFWDCETWIYPTLLLTHTDMARDTLIKYRLDRTKGASLKAQSYKKGYQGFMFPWESAFTGEEVCPSWAPTGQLEQHITGDIAFAMRQYWYLTQDEEWLKSAYYAIEGIANFWVSRVEWNQKTNLYNINGVIPPDEWAVNVNNSAYTNVVAGISLEFAIEVATLLGKPVPPEWSRVANRMYVPVDTHLNIHLEYDTYTGGQIKQADVILLGYPLMYPMSTQMRLNDLMYYQDRTSPTGPAMTYAMETIAWLELGQPAQALKQWNSSWANAKDPFMVWTETPTGGTVNFITGAGGFLQAVVFGYGGARIRQNEIQFNPQLPSPVTSMQFSKINYRGNQLQIRYDSSSSTVTKLNNNGDALVLVDVKGSVHTIGQNEQINVPRGLFTIKPQQKE